MVSGNINTATIPTDLDYLAPADTALTIVPTAGIFQFLISDNLTFTMVDVSGRNSVRKVVVVATARELP